MKKTLFVFIFIVKIQFICFSKNIIIPKNETFPKNITTYLEIYEDSTGIADFKEIKSHAGFTPHSKKHFLFPFSNSVFWVRFKIVNEHTQEENFKIEWFNPLVEQLTFYVQKDSSEAFSQKKYNLLTKEKTFKNVDESITHSFQLKSGESKQIYIRLNSRRGHFGAIYLHTELSYLKSFTKNVSSQSYLNGLLIFRLLLVLVLGIFVIREIAFRLYSLHIVVKTVGFYGFVSIIGPYFSDSSEIAKIINFIAYNSVSFGAGLFLLYTVKVHSLPKFLQYFTLLFSFLTIFLNILVIFDYQWYWLKFGIYNIVFSSLFYLFSFFYLWIKGFQTSKYYAFMFILGMISSVFLYIRLLGWIEFQPVYTIAYIIFMIEIFTIYFFLGRIFTNTERNKLLAEQKLQFNEEQTQKLIELDQIKSNLFTNISHEFRTPLTLILAPVNDLLKKYPDNESFKIIQRNANKLLQLINQILDLSKLESGKMQIQNTKFDLVKFFRTLVSSYSSLAQSRGIRFSFSQNKERVIAITDQDKLEQIVTNLLSNAFKFTPDGKSISIAIQYENNNLIFKVEDTGIGIKSNELLKIFERFYQSEDSVDRRFEGTGIGLALVKEIVDALKGTINVQSKINSGSTFEVKIPMMMDNNSEPLNETEEEEKSILTEPIKDQKRWVDNGSSPEKNKSILIVEDNRDIRSYISGIFMQDFKIIEAANGTEALNKTLEYIPDIIISDLMMPGMDGFTFCKALNSDTKTSHIPVILLTAKGNLETKIEGLELGVDDFLVKPFHTDEIKVRVNNILKRQEKLQKLYNKKIYDLKPDQINVPTMEETFILKVKKILEENISDNGFGVEQFSIAIGMSQSQLLRKIKALSNKTVVEFIRDYRLQKAADLIRQNSSTISEIAFSVGFENTSYFSKMFNEKFGKLPSEYLINKQNEENKLINE